MMSMKRLGTLYMDEALEFLRRYQPITAFKLARRIQALCKLGIYPYHYRTHYHLYSRLLVLFHRLEKDGVVEQKGPVWYIK